MGSKFPEPPLKGRLPPKPSPPPPVPPRQRADIDMQAEAAETRVQLQRITELTAAMRRLQRECAAAGSAVTHKQLAARQLAEIQVDAALNLVERR